ncbi:MAG: hypothetical protein OEY38_21600 [Gammaproteobacteria bacterium]|nr:hypothetical protein [Gammaproteobacteria bacterium]
MGILWTVYPITKEMKEHLESEGVEYPEVSSTFPNDEQIKQALNELEGVNIEISSSDPSKGWGAFISSTSSPEDIWANLQVDILENDQSRRSIWFEKGDENLIIYFLKQLSKKCGPQTLMADAGGPPQVINA